MSLEPVTASTARATRRAGWAAWAAQSPLLAVLVAALIGGVIAALAGHDPWRVYGEIVRGSLLDGNLTQTLNWSIGLVGMAISAAIALRGGLVNLGGDGQLVIGGLVGAVVALSLPAPGVVRIALALLAAMLAAGGYAALAALGEVRFGVPLLVTTLLMGYVARGVASYLVRFPLKDPLSGLPETLRLPEAARLPLLGGSLEAGLVFVGLVALLALLLDWRSVAGFELRLRGLNPRFVRYGGVDLARQTVGALFSSGAVAGLVGALIVLGSQYRFTDGALLSQGYSYSGLMAALLAGGAPAGTLLAGLFFAALQTGGFAMERATGVPRVLTLILQAVMILVLAVRGSLRR